MKQKLRVSCKPEEAEIAILEGIEWRKTTAPWPWVSDGMPSMNTAQLVKLGATFEKELPEVGDGKEYEYKKGDGSGGQLPKGTMLFLPGSGRWDLIEHPLKLQEFTNIYAIPLKKSCVVEGTVGTHPLFDGMCAIVPHDSFDYQQKVYILPKEGTTRHYARWDQGRICIQDEAWVGKTLEVLVREL